MNLLSSVATGASPASLPPNLSDVISTIGSDVFNMTLADYLGSVCGADHCAVFKWEKERLVNVSSVSLDGTDTAHRQASLYIDNQHWKRDPSMAEAYRHVGDSEISLHKLDVRILNDSGLRDVVYGRPHIRERVLLCGGLSTSTLILSILRSERSGVFPDEELDRLRGVTLILLSLLYKHMELVERSGKLAKMLSCLADIEACIATSPERFPRREAEVAARILYGISSIGIALDLEISEETVMTYRKRAYQRLGIGSQRELLLWFIALWCSPRNPKMHRSASAAAGTGGLGDYCRSYFQLTGLA